jgi:hypothetical protein
MSWTNIFIAFTLGAEMQRVLVIVGAVVLVACGRKSSTAPTPADVVGSWSGPISDALLGPGTLSMSLTQTGDSVTGFWSTSFPDSAEDLDGYAAGNVFGPTLTVVLKPSNPPTCTYGPFDITAAVNGTMSMNGTFVTIQCAAADSGTFSASRQQ